MLSVYLVAGVTGIILFFSFVIAPTVFRVLPAEWAKPFVRSFFPRYYAVLGGTSLLAAWLAQDALLSHVSLACGAVFLFLLLILTPAINRAADRQQQHRFRVLHGLSVLLNFVQLGLLVWALYRVAT